MKEATSRFDVLVTLDQDLRFQNPTGKYPLGIVVLITQFNHVAAYRPQFAEIRDLANLQPLPPQKIRGHLRRLFMFPVHRVVHLLHLVG